MAQVFCLFVVAKACMILLFQLKDQREEKRIFQPERERIIISKVDTVVLPLRSPQNQLYKTTIDLVVPDCRLGGCTYPPWGSSESKLSDKTIQVVMANRPGAFYDNVDPTFSYPIVLCNDSVVDLLSSIRLSTDECLEEVELRDLHDSLLDLAV